MLAHYRDVEPIKGRLQNHRKRNHGTPVYDDRPLDTRHLWDHGSERKYTVMNPAGIVAWGIVTARTA